MSTLSTQHRTSPITRSPLSREHSQFSTPIAFRTFCLVTRGDAPLCGAVCEPVGMDQSTAIANAVYEHLVQEQVLAVGETVLVYTGLYQYFSLLDQGFRLLPRIQTEVENRLTPRQRFARATSVAGLSSETLDMVVHTTHRSQQFARGNVHDRTRRMLSLE